MSFTKHVLLCNPNLCQDTEHTHGPTVFTVYFQPIGLMCAHASECCIYFYSEVYELYMFKEGFKYIPKTHTALSCLGTSLGLMSNKQEFGSEK